MTVDKSDFNQSTFLEEKQYLVHSLDNSKLVRMIIQITVYKLVAINLSCLFITMIGLFKFG